MNDHQLRSSLNLVLAAYYGAGTIIRLALRQIASHVRYIYENKTIRGHAGFVNRMNSKRKR